MDSESLTPLDSVELREVRIPLQAPFETSFGRETLKEALLVIAKKDGLTAYGECVAGTGPWYNEETIVSAKDIIKRFLTPTLLSETIETPSAFIDFAARIRGNNMAVAAVEMALWDLMGKMKRKSIAKLLGGQKTEVQVGVSIGIQSSVGKLTETVSEYLKDGYRRIKVKIKPGYDIEPVRAIREAFPDIMLQVDANSAYSIDDSEALRKLDEFDLLLIEQPLAHDDIVDHSKLQKLLSTAICLDESIRSSEDARKALEIGACRIINIKPGRMRGLHLSKQLHDLCLQRRIPVWCGGMLETGIGRAFNVALASMPGFTLPGDTSASKRYFRQDIISREFELTKDGTLEVPTGPGIGVEINENILDSYTTGREEIKSPNG